jgi:murein DD-endopeptidase MepM/ murein hydrolase activator NlpD
VGQQPARAAGVRRERRRGSGQIFRAFFLPLGLVLALGWGTGWLDYGHWWLTNTTAPSLSLTGPRDVVGGVVSVAVHVGPEGRARIVEARVDDRPVAVEEPLAVDTATLPDGSHAIAVVAEDSSWRRNRAGAEIAIHSDNTPPRLALEPRAEEVRQGHTWLLRVRTDEPAAIEASLGGAPVALHEGDGFGWAIVGVTPEAAPTDFALVVKGADRVGNRAERQATIRVVAENFPRDDIDLPPSLLPLLDPRVRDDEDARLAPIYANVSRPRLWDGRFTPPVQGPVITRFGEVRSYNGGSPAGHHGGVDFAAPAGRPVLAPARGRVVLIDQLRVRGGVVVLDHGLGVMTTYAHLSGVDVRVGQEVQRGQPLARVGSTGLSTGPHLHWELRVGGVHVDALEWIEQSFP